MLDFLPSTLKIHLHQHFLLLAPLDGDVAAEFREGEAVGDVADDDTVDDRGRETREPDGPRDL